MVKSGQAWAGTFVTTDPATGAVTAATGTPVGTLYVDGVADAATVTETGSNPYKFSVTLPTLTAGQRVDMCMTATVAGVNVAGIVASAQADTVLESDLGARLPAALVSGRIDASVGAMAAATVTAAAIATDAIDADAVADGAITSGVFAAGAITASAIATDAIGASELAADAVAEIADQVWDEVLSGHATAGSTGAALSAAGSAGDPWSTTLPGAYSTGTAGHWIGTKLLGYIKSLTRSDYAEETDIGGTYDAASDSLEAIRDALRQGALTISNPGMVAGGFEIVAGDSYNNDDGNLPLTFTWTETAGRSFGSKSGVINGVNNAGATFAWDCTLAQASTTVTVTVEDLDSTETDLTPGADWRWMLTVTMGSGNETTPVRGTMVVLERPGA